MINMNKITPFTITTFVIGIICIVGTMDIYFNWQLITALIAVITGGVILFGLFMVLLSIMSLFL